MNLINTLIGLELKLKQYKAAFIFLFLFWFCGFLGFVITEPNVDLLNLFLYSVTIRNPSNPGDYANAYALLWPILLEVIVFGFIIGELLEKYNPVVTSRIIASHKRNHLVVIGYQHLSERIIEYCLQHKFPFCIIEDDYELVEDLITSGCPVVVGDATQTINLKYASIHRAKEVYININDTRIAIICTEKIRKMNPKCQIYVRAFEEHVREYLKEAPLNAFPYSTSNWAMGGIKKWTKNKQGNTIVIGRDYLTHRIAYHISTQPNREVYLFDDEHDGIEFPQNDRVHMIKDFSRYVSELEEYVDLKKVSQAFICWKEDSEFDESLYLTSKLHLLYPHIELYVRIFDEELIELVEKYDAKIFSTSRRAFKQLRKQVGPNSSLSLLHDKT